jgi:hypothetical protein
MESKVPFRVKMESLQKTSGGIFSGKFYYGTPGAGVGFGRFPANTSTPQGRIKHFTATVLLPVIKLVFKNNDYKIFNRQYFGAATEKDEFGEFSSCPHAQ